MLVVILNSMIQRSSGCEDAFANGNAVEVLL